MQTLILAPVLFAVMLCVTPAFAITSEQGTSPSGTYNNLADPDEQSPGGLNMGGMHFNMSGSGNGGSNSNSYGRPDDGGNMPATVGEDMQRQQQMRQFGIFDQMQPR